MSQLGRYIFYRALLKMKLVVHYEDEIYDFTFSQSVDILSYVNILDQRPLLNCWLEDYVTKVWIRVPRIEVLRMFLKEFPVDNLFRLRFQADSKSPNSSPHLSLTKKEINDKDVSKTEVENDPGTMWALSIADNLIEPCTRLAVAEVEVGDLVLIQQESTDMFAPRLSLHAESLLTAVRCDAEKGINPFEVMVKAEVENNKWQEVKLTRQVWMKCLLRGNPRASMFLDYVTVGFENLFMLGDKLKELHAWTDLWLRLKCFHWDLKHFDEQAQSRLENYGGEYYMSDRYFSQEELSYLLTFPTASGATARQSLQAVFTSKGSFGMVCTSHDIAPAVERIYGIRKGYETEKAFKIYFKRFTARKGTF